MTKCKGNQSIQCGGIMIYPVTARAKFSELFNFRNEWISR